MKKHKLLHNGKKKSMQRSINKLLQLRQENIKNEKTVELIDVILNQNTNIQSQKGLSQKSIFNCF